MWLNVKLCQFKGDGDSICKEVRELYLGALQTVLVQIENLSYPDIYKAQEKNGSRKDAILKKLWGNVDHKVKNEKNVTNINKIKKTKQNRPY